jgi:hypothetical protein
MRGGPLLYPTAYSIDPYPIIKPNGAWAGASEVQHNPSRLVMVRSDHITDKWLIFLVSLYPAPNFLGLSQTRFRAGMSVPLLYKLSYSLVLRTTIK